MAINDKWLTMLLSEGNPGLLQHLKRKTEPLDIGKKCISLVCDHPSYHCKVSQRHDKFYSGKIDKRWCCQANAELNSSATWVNKCPLLFNLCWFFCAYNWQHTDSSEWMVKWKEYFRGSVQMWHENVRHLACLKNWERGRSKKRWGCRIIKTMPAILSSSSGDPLKGFIWGSCISTLPCKRVILARRIREGHDWRKGIWSEAYFGKSKVLKHFGLQTPLY